MTPEPMTHQVYSGVSRIRRILKPAPTAVGLRILSYHSVGGALAADPYGTSIDPRLFESHMTALASLRGAWDLPVGLRAAGGTPALAVTFDDGYKDTLTVACPILARLGLPMTVFVATSHLDSSGLYLSKAELKQLSAVQGVTIGAHGHAHTALDRLSDEALKEDLATSRKILEDALGWPVTSLSYPYGRASRRVRDAAKAAGYTLGCCSRYGFNDAGRDPLLLCRTEIVAWDTVDDLILKTTGHWDWFALRQPEPERI